MKWFVAASAVALAAQLVAQEKSPAGRPPVLESADPSDDVVVTLPGAAAALPPALPALPVPDDDGHRPLLRRAPKPVFPAEFERDSAAFSQRLIGVWTHPDAYNLFGDPLRDRPALDDDQVESGRIYAFSDPTGRYREIELDFAKDSGILRTVFVYPWKMTWTDCRKLWGANVQSTPANKGRIFHSYLNRRLDVLVDQAGKVISIGLY
jgi:hypothetical protein